MKKLLALLASAFALLASPALATNCPTFSYVLTNGSTADANQVMANFNTLLSCTNTLLAHSGANSDITSLSGLITPLSQAQGGTGTTNLFGLSNTWTGTQAFQADVTHTAKLNLTTGTTLLAPLNFTAGTNLTTPVAGAMEWDGTNLYITQTTGPTRKTIPYTTGSIATLTTPRTISLTGDVTATTGGFDGSGNVTAAATIASAAVTNAKLASMGAATVKGSVAGGVPADLTATQVVGLLPAASNTGTVGVTALASTAQSQAGSSTTVALTPGGFFSLAKSMSSGLPGYATMPGGLIIEWGSTTSTGSGTGNITLPLSFPTGTFSASITALNGGSGTPPIYSITGLSTATLSWRSTGPDSNGLMWIALGF